MANDTDNNVALETLLQTLNENPELWDMRKKVARMLFADQAYAEAADIVWNAPTIPSTDVDVAFALKMISRVKPNRSIRLIYEVLKRNKDKPLKNMAVARALNEVGLYMEAARFYGAALADDTSLFDLAFERQMLWLDDSGRLIEEWRESDQESNPPLDVEEQDILGGAIEPAHLPESPQVESSAPATIAPALGVPPLPQPIRPATPGVTLPPNPAAGRPVIPTQPIAPGGKPFSAPSGKPLALNTISRAQTSPLSTAPAGGLNTAGTALPVPPLPGGSPMVNPALGGIPQVPTSTHGPPVQGNNPPVVSTSPKSSPVTIPLLPSNGSIPILRRAPVAGVTAKPTVPAPSANSSLLNVKPMKPS